MKSKSILTFLLGLQAACLLQAQDSVSNVFISGRLKHFENQEEVEDMTDIGRLSLPNPNHYIIADSAGQFKIDIYVAAPGYFRIGRNILYLSPGDSLYAEIDLNNPEKASFRGSNWQANAYLRFTPFPKAGSYATIDSLIKPTVEECIASFEAYGRQREQLLISPILAQVFRRRRVTCDNRFRRTVSGSTATAPCILIAASLAFCSNTRKP